MTSRCCRTAPRSATSISRGEVVDTTTPLPERKIYPGEQVRFLAACPLTQVLALSDEDMAELSRV